MTMDNLEEAWRSFSLSLSNKLLLSDEQARVSHWLTCGFLR
jgi:hypothetical protein